MLIIATVDSKFQRHKVTLTTSGKSHAVDIQPRVRFRIFGKRWRVAVLGDGDVLRQRYLSRSREARH